MGLDKQLRIRPRIERDDIGLESCTMTNSNIRNVKIWVRLRHNLLDTQIVNLFISLSEKLRREVFRDGCISYKECLRKSVSCIKKKADFFFVCCEV